MKTLQKTKTILASAIVVGLTGCGSDNYTPPTTENLNAPEHGGNIEVTVHEKDAFQFLNALGGLDGQLGTEGKAIDKDGDVLTIRNGTLTPADAVGVEPKGPMVGIRPSAVAPLIDTGDVYTVVLSYDISDGDKSVPRTMTINFTGEDAAPVAVGDLVGNFTKDAGTGTLNLLTNVTDADEEPLTVEQSSVIADGNNPFDISFSVAENMIDFDIASIADQVPAGQKVTLRFTYLIKDHNHEVQRNMVVNILGVKDVPGAPLIPDYFLTSEINETDTVQLYDLAKDVIDREGDSVLVHDLTLDGSATLPYGVELNGNTLSLDPHAYFNQVNAGEFKELLFSFKISDDQGNTSDGERTLTVKLNGEQTNIIAASFPNYDFEDASQVGPLDASTNPGGFAWGWAGWACPEKAFQAESARTGNYGMRMTGSFCHFDILNAIPTLENDQKYVVSYWFRNQTAGTNPYVPLWFQSVGETGLNNRFWWGARFWDQSLNKWFEHAQLINTYDAGNFDGYENLSLSMSLMKYDDSYAGGTHDIDDISIVKFGDFDTAAHDMLVDNVGLFENNETIASSGGVVEIRDDGGDHKLYVNTAGETSVTISLPIKAGAIRVGERFALSLDAQLINHDALYAVDANTKVDYNVSLSNGTESIAANGVGSTWGPNISSSDVIITEEYGRSADIDWSAETMTLTITFTEANAEYYINNVRLIAIP